MTEAALLVVASMIHDNRKLVNRAFYCFLRSVKAMELGMIQLLKMKQEV